MSALTVGQIVANSAPFVTPIDAYFAAGTLFTVDLVGEVNTRAIEFQTGSVVWICNYHGEFCGKPAHEGGKPAYVRSV
jgi:hypothetical protein